MIRYTTIGAALLILTGTAFAQEPAGPEAAPAATPPAGQGAPPSVDPAAEPEGERVAATSAEPSAEPDGEPSSAAAAQVPGGPRGLAGMSILGNQEAPTSLVIVPWKSSEIGNGIGVSRALDTGIHAVDRDVFMRELRYYEIRTGGGD
jgi:hypothetical protein